METFESTFIDYYERDKDAIKFDLTKPEERYLLALINDVKIIGKEKALEKRKSRQYIICHAGRTLKDHYITSNPTFIDKLLGRKEHSSKNKNFIIEWIKNIFIENTNKQAIKVGYIMSKDRYEPKTDLKTSLEWLENDTKTTE